MDSGQAGEAGENLDFLFVHHQEVDVVEQRLDLPGGRGGVEDVTAAPARAAATAWLPPLPPGLYVASEPRTVSPARGRALTRMFWSILRLPTTKTVLTGPAPSVVRDGAPSRNT